VRYTTDHKEHTRQKIVATASGLFRKDGVVATGVVGLMKHAGLTQGGFYAHFESKEALVREAAAAAVLETAAGLRQVADRAGSGPEALRAVIEAYLSERHVDGAERGCCIAAIGGELAREPEATRKALFEASRQTIALISNNLPPGRAQRHGLATAVFGLLSGTLQLARLCVDAKERDAILMEGRQAAFRLCEI
jgi:TetR/AcrR family transcriptional repressor of nem operon